MCEGIEGAVCTDAEFEAEAELKAENDTLWELFQYLIRQGNTTVVFMKANGTERTMNCALTKEAIGSYDFKTKDGEEEIIIPATVQPVWSIDDAGWRSVKKGTIISVEATIDIEVE